MGGNANEAGERASVAELLSRLYKDIQLCIVTFNHILLDAGSCG